MTCETEGNTISVGHDLAIMCGLPFEAKGVHLWEG